jgi:hypothetical protein
MVLALLTLAGAQSTAPNQQATTQPKSVALTDKSNVPPSDILKELRKGCPNVGITNARATSDYTLEVNNKPDPTASGSAGYQGTVFALILLDRDGKILRSTLTPSLGNAVKDVCHAINTAVIVEVVEAQNLTQSVDVRGSGRIIPALTGRRTHTDTATISVIVNGEHALLDCYEHATGCATIRPGKYYGELDGGSVWVNYEVPLTHEVVRNHYVIAGSW